MHGRIILFPQKSKQKLFVRSGVKYTPIQKRSLPQTPWTVLQEDEEEEAESSEEESDEEEEGGAEDEDEEEDYAELTKFRSRRSYRTTQADQ